MINDVIVVVFMFVELVALILFITSKRDKKGFAIRCITDSLFLGCAIAHLIPCSALFYNTTFDIVLNIVFAVGFAYFLYCDYKSWKNAK